MDLGTSITRILFLKQIGFWMKATAFPRPPLALQPTDVQMSSDKGVKQVHATVGEKEWFSTTKLRWRRGLPVKSDEPQRWRLLRRVRMYWVTTAAPPPNPSLWPTRSTP